MRLCPHCEATLDDTQSKIITCVNCETLFHKPGMDRDTWSVEEWPGEW